LIVLDSDNSSCFSLFPKHPNHRLRVTSTFGRRTGRGADGRTESLLARDSLSSTAEWDWVWCSERSLILRVVHAIRFFLVARVTTLLLCSTIDSATGSLLQCCPMRWMPDIRRSAGAVTSRLVRQYLVERLAVIVC